MRSSHRARVAGILVPFLILALFLTGCGKAPATPAPAPQPAAAPSAQPAGGSAAPTQPAAQPAQPAAPAGPPIKIGVISAQTGALEAYGIQQVRGLKLGFEYATGGTMQVLGREIQLIVEDDGGNPETAVTKVRKLIEQDGVDLLTGSVSSGATLAIIPEIERARKLLMVEPAAADSITGENCSPYVFRTARNVSQDAVAAANYLQASGLKRFMNLAPDYAFGHDSAAAWTRIIESRGGEIIDNIFAPFETRDFSPYLQRLLQARPDGVVVTWAGAGAVTLFQQIAEMDIYDEMLVMTGIADTDALRAFGTSAAGLTGFAPYYYELPRTEANDWLVQRHFEEYNAPPELFTAGGMAAAIAIVQGIEAAGSTDTEALRAALSGMSFAGPKGTYTFRPEDQQALQPMYMVRLEIKDGYDYPVPTLVEEIPTEQTGPAVTCKY